MLTSASTSPFFIAVFYSFIYTEVCGSDKLCIYRGNGDAKSFSCASFEYCCGNFCCENITQFWRLWYFWFCVILGFLFCSGGGYWYHRRYLQQGMIIGPPQTTTVVTMTTTTTGSVDGTCTGIPTGMTYLPSGSSLPMTLSLNQAPPAYSSLGQQNGVHLSDHAASYSVNPGAPPPSYESVYKEARQGRRGHQQEYTRIYEYELL